MRERASRRPSPSSGSGCRPARRRGSRRTGRGRRCRPAPAQWSRRSPEASDRHRSNEIRAGHVDPVSGRHDAARPLRPRPSPARGRAAIQGRVPPPRGLPRGTGRRRPARPARGPALPRAGSSSGQLVLGKDDRLRTEREETASAGLVLGPGEDPRPRVRGARPLHPPPGLERVGDRELGPTGPAAGPLDRYEYAEKGAHFLRPVARLRRNGRARHVSGRIPSTGVAPVTKSPGTPTEAKSHTARMRSMRCRGSTRCHGDQNP